MPTTQYFQTRDSNGTSNLNHLLPEHAQKLIEAITPSEVESIFGPGQAVDIPEKGYTDPEWYFESSDGCVWGIGWRWGRTRLRGKGSIKRSRHFFVQPTPTQAAEFVDYLTSEIEKWGE